MRIGKYRILFNPHKLFWVQTYKPTVVRRWWWFLVLEEVDVLKTDKKKRHKLGTVATSLDRRWKYYKSGAMK